MSCTAREGLVWCACLFALEDSTHIRPREELVLQCQAACLDPKTEEDGSVCYIFFSRRLRFDEQMHSS